MTTYEAYKESPIGGMVRALSKGFVADKHVVQW